MPHTCHAAAEREGRAPHNHEHSSDRIERAATRRRHRARAVGTAGAARTIAAVRRIAVIGCGGAGKTTLANELSRHLHLPVLHIDGFYWQQQPRTGRLESTPEEWRRIHEELISGERWVIDGMKLGVLPARLAAADTVVFLDLPTWRCLWGVLERRVRFRGQMRPDIGVYDHISVEFVRWIWSFRRRVRPRVLELLDDCSCQVVILQSRRQVAAFLATLQSRPERLHSLRGGARMERDVA